MASNMTNVTHKLQNLKKLWTCTGFTISKIISNESK